MNLANELQRYLRIRRSLGYKLYTEERILKRFIFFMEQNKETHINADIFLKWKQEFGKASKITWARRLGVIRVFASWLCSLDPLHEIPSQSLVPFCNNRIPPYIYSDSEIKKIIKAASLLQSKNGIREITYPAFFGLISVTGLRISEAISLNTQDVNLREGIITVHKGKNDNNRKLPITESTNNYLKEYARIRDRFLGQTPEPFFVSDNGIRLTDCAVRYNFAVVSQMIGLRPERKDNKHGVGPRIHDLRHTFAVKVMVNWYKEGKNIDQEMIKLVTYLGHTKPANTYWYIEAVPELLALASQRVENYMEEAL